MSDDYTRGEIAGKIEADEDRIDAISRRLDEHISGCWWRFAILIAALGAFGWFEHIHGR